MAGLLPFAPGPASAHAILVESAPAPGGAVASGHFALRLRYNSRIDRSRSKLTITLPDGAQSRLPIDDSGPPDILTSQTDLQPGSYVLHWQVLAVDGHITRGDVRFSVAGS
ncbi:MAG: copper resistance protein CopC [Acetobacteraceae bacterium]|nr:copper resistance protein CopC [Acetobacteraceae bacterium]